MTEGVKHSPCAKPSELETLVDNLQAGSIMLDPASFHVFEYRGRRLLYDVKSTAVLEVNNPLAFQLLKELEDNGGDIDRFHSTGGDVSTEKVLEEINRLKEMGLFVLEPAVSRRNVERNLDNLSDHHPNKILLMVSQSCNYRCVYCYAVENNFPDEGKLMEETIALRAIDYLFRVSGKRNHLAVTFFGGEPLLNFPVICKVVDYTLAKAEKEGRTVEFLMSTNGSLITDKVADYLVKHGFSILVSLDGPPEAHNRFRRTKSGRPSHDLSLQGALKLLQRCPVKRSIKVKAVMNHESHDMLSVIEYLENLGFTNIGIGGTHPRPWMCEDFDLCEEDAIDLTRHLEALLDRFLDRLDKGLPLGYNPFCYSLRTIGEKHQMLGIGCGVGRNCNAVSVDGSIYPCHRYVGMERYVLGDVFDGLDREKTLNYYRALIDNAERSCRLCWSRYICGGECPWLVSKSDGSIWPPHPQGCKDKQSNIERTIWVNFELEKRHPNYLNRYRGYGRSAHRV